MLLPMKIFMKIMVIPINNYDNANGHDSKNAYYYYY